MAAPNIVNVSNITGKTAAAALTTTSQDLLVNAASSSKVLKVNTLAVANISGTAAASVTVTLFRNSTEFRLASTIFVPANATLVIISKDAAIYLEEGDTIRAVASLNNYLHAVCSYESIS
jgi:hypothetical protein